MRDKRGLSAIITTLLVIVLVFLAVGIVWAVVNSFITDTTEGLEVQGECNKVDLQIVSNGTCDATACAISVERKGSATSPGIEVATQIRVVNDTEASASLDATLIGHLERKSLTASSSHGGVTRIEVYPVVRDGSDGDFTICPAATDTKTF